MKVKISLNPLSATLREVNNFKFWLYTYNKKTIKWNGIKSYYDRTSSYAIIKIYIIEHTRGKMGPSDRRILEHTIEEPLL